MGVAVLRRYPSRQMSATSYGGRSLRCRRTVLAVADRVFAPGAGSFSLYFRK